MITIIQSNINVKASIGNGDEPEKIYLHFLPQMISATTSLRIVIEL
jgi:hypothetical protein